MRSLVLPPGFWFCREVFCFCREVFSFAVTVVGHRSFSPQNLLSDPLAFSRVSVGCMVALTVDDSFQFPTILTVDGYQVEI